MFQKLYFLFLPALFCMPAAAQINIERNEEISRMVNEVSADSLQAYINTLVGFGTRHTLSSQTDPHRGIGAAREWVYGKFRQFAAHSGGRMTVKMDRWLQPADSHRVNRAVPMANVMATFGGSDPADSRVFIVSAHLDSRNSDIMDSTGSAPGANDDGSGVAALLEMARILSGWPTRATVILVAVTGEEQGLLGATHLAEEATEGHWQVAAMLNNDMIGQSTSSETDKHDNTRIRVFSEGIPAMETKEEAALRKALSGDNDSKSRELARYIKMICGTYIDNLEVQLIYRRDRFLRGGDHLPFQQRGFRAVRLTDFYENYTHQHQNIRTEQGIAYGDLPQFVDDAYLRKNTGLNLAVLASLAGAPAEPEGVKIDVTQLSNTTRLYWQAPHTGTVKGYYVLMRETDQSMWQKKIFTKATDIVLPYSRDNFFFAVQAVGEDGLMSLPVFPAIGRKRR